MRLTTKGRFAVTAMIDLALRQNNGPVTLAATSLSSPLADQVAAIPWVAKQMKFQLPTLFCL